MATEVTYEIHADTAHLRQTVEALELRLDKRADNHRTVLTGILNALGLTWDSERENFTLGRRWNAETETWQELKLVKEWRDA